MIRRTSEQWLALIDQHKTSGLTQTAFAKQHGIDPSYFSLRKRQLLAWQQDDNDGFVELTSQGVLFCQPMVLKKRDVEFHLPAGTDALWVATISLKQFCQKHGQHWFQGQTSCQRSFG